MRISLIIGAIPILVTALLALWSTPEGGGDANTCGSIVHVQLASGHCQEVRIGYYLFSVGLAIVFGLLLAAVVYATSRFWPGSGSGGDDSPQPASGSGRPTSSMVAPPADAGESGELAELAPATTDDLPLG
jgi:hypothetical protein